MLSSGWYILGKEVSSFEKQFSKYIAVRHSIGVANGLEALQIALLACGIKKGDEVITTPISAAATALAIIHAGATPVFADVDPQTLLIDPREIQKAVTKKTKAIIPVHLYGQMCDMPSIMKLAKKHHLKVIEDCAQAAGAALGNRKAGSFGDFGAFSFYPTKNLGAYGDGGCLTTGKSDLAKLARAIRDYGQIGKYEHYYTGFNSRLDELQAAMLGVKMRFLNRWNSERIGVARKYTNLLDGLHLETPQIPDDSSHIFHLYVIKTEDRNQLITYLRKKSIDVQVHYPKVLYKQRAISRFSKGHCPVAEKSVKRIISLPIYPELSQRQIEFICQQIRNFYQ